MQRERNHKRPRVLVVLFILPTLVDCHAAIGKQLEVADNLAVEEQQPATLPEKELDPAIIAQLLNIAANRGEQAMYDGLPTLAKPKSDGAFEAIAPGGDPP